MRRLFIVILKFPDLMLVLLGTILFRLLLFFVVSTLGVESRIVADATVSPKHSISEFGLMIQNYRTYYTQFAIHSLLSD